MGDWADEVVCARTPEPFIATHPWYQELPSPDEEQIWRLLEAARLRQARLVQVAAR